MESNLNQHSTSQSVFSGDVKSAFYIALVFPMLYAALLFSSGSSEQQLAVPVMSEKEKVERLHELLRASKEEGVVQLSDEEKMKILEGLNADSSQQSVE